MLIRYILYTGIVLISICNGELLLLSKPDNDKTVYSCLASGDDENSTLFWWSNNKPLNLLPSNPFEEEEIKIASNNWSNGLSFSFNVEPLTDERWEDLPIIKIGRNKSHEISHSSIMRLSLSFYAEDEVQLLFNNNNRIIFRNQELPTENIFLIQYRKWNHISLTKTKFYLNSNQKIVSFNIDLSNVKIQPINEDSYWKIHNYTLFYAKGAEKTMPVAQIRHNGEPLCLSFFITMCNNCSLTFYMNNVNRSIQTQNHSNQWQKHNIYFPKTNTSILQLYTSSNNSQEEYWIIHKFTKCRKGLRSSIVITKESNVTCTNSEEPKELKSRNTCFEEDYYSKFCKLKLKSEYKDPCKQSKICIENKGCVCSWGYKGKNCAEECERGKWGINCNNTCGNCAKSETCDKFTGKCDECAENYSGNYCYDLPKIHLSDISFTSSVINLQNGIYQARQLHYKSISENTWTTIQIYNISYVNIINLQAGQAYQLKLFYNISSTCEFELDFAETNFTTKFEGNLTKEELPEAVSVTSNFISITQCDNSKLKGTLQYVLSFTCLCAIDVNDITVNYQYASKLNNISIPTDLQYCCNCRVNLSIQRKFERIPYESNIVFRNTDCARMHDLTVYSKNNTNIWISWKPRSCRKSESKYIDKYNICIVNSTLPNCRKTTGEICKLMHCTTIKLLQENEQYDIKINSTGAEESDSSTPTTLVDLTTNNILQFQSPFETNLTIIENNRNDSIINSGPDQITILNYSTTYNASTSVENECGVLDIFTIITTPPSKPEFVEVPQIKNCEKSYCLLEFSETKNDCENCTLYLFTIKNDNLTKLDTACNSTTFANLGKNANISKAWIQIDKRNLSKSDNKFHINITETFNQSTIRHYHFCSIVINTYKEKIEMYTCVVEHPKNLDYLIIGAYTSSFILVGLIFLLIKCLVNKISKTQNKVSRISEEEDDEEMLQGSESTDNSIDNSFDDIEPSSSILVYIDDYNKYLSACSKKDIFRKQYEMCLKTLSEKIDDNHIYSNTVVYNNKQQSVNFGPINANYINGFKSNKTYMVMKEPDLYTVNEFWNIILKENVNFIIMLTNVANQKTQFFYWPKKKETKIYSDFTITYSDKNKCEYFTIRTFHIKKNNDVRVIKHLHFTYCLKKSVSFCSKIIVPLIKKIADFDTQAPIVIHGRDGIERTGAIIMSDMAIRMIKLTEHVDFPQILSKIKNQCYQLVELDDYILVHSIIYEYFFGMKFSISVNENFYEVLTSDLKSKVAKHILKCLNKSCLAKLKQEEIDNKGQIEATFIDSFQANKFIVIQHPFQNTDADIWRLILKNNVRIIINLNEIESSNVMNVFFRMEKNCLYKPLDFVTILCEDEENYDVLNVKKYMVSSNNNRETKATIYLITVHRWKPSELLPRDFNTLLQVHKMCVKLQDFNNWPIIVTCSDGTTASGLFLALHFLLEVLKEEHSLDVYLALQNLKQYDKKFVTHEKQVEFLYYSAREYVKNFPALDK